jgi:hypothetical protein
MANSNILRRKERPRMQFQNGQSFRNKVVAGSGRGAKRAPAFEAFKK